MSRRSFQKNGIQHLAIFLDPKAAATNAFGAQGLPSSYLIARDGTIVGKEEGGAAWDDPAMLAKLTPYHWTQITLTSCPDLFPTLSPTGERRG